MTKDEKSKNARQASSNKKQPVYETPAIVILGELARGSGICSTGSNPTGGPIICTTGPSARVNPPANCSRGFFAGSTCTRGVRG